MEVRVTFPAGFDPDRKRDKPAVYDCFTFFNELDLLEIRLRELAPAVDYFVLTESNETFRGQPKELIFEKNKSRFAPFLDKIIHITTSDTAEPGLYRPVKVSRSSAVWTREGAQRNSIIDGSAMPARTTGSWSRALMIFRVRKSSIA